jgi:hypothetical protein
VQELRAAPAAAAAVIAVNAVAHPAEAPLGGAAARGRAGAARAPP